WPDGQGHPMTWSESHAQLSGRHDGYRHNPVPRRVRHPAHAGSIFRPRPALALHRGRDRVGARGGALWRHSAGSSGRDRGEMQCRNPRPRSRAPGDRDRRLSDPSLGASAGEAMRRCGPLRPLGATTQDIMDTAVVLQLREGLGIIEEDVAQLRSILAKLAKTHRDTPMAGRTHLQQALPITFGYKAAIWLAMFDRHAERLTQLKPRVLVGEFAGAAGTLASLGEKGLEVQKAFCEELRLGVPVSTWHVARDAFAETINLLALITGSLGKIALDIMLMASPELAEVYEPFVKGRGASS